MRRARRTTIRPALWSPDGVEPLSGTSYLEHLARLLQPDGRGPLPEGGYPLPDEPEPDPDPGSAGWWRSALDGVMSVRGGRSDGDAPLLAAAAVLEACRNPLGTTSAHTVADRLTALQSPQDVDRMLEAIRLDARVSRLRLAELARWLCRFGVRAWQVKGGLALLGISGTPGDVPLVARLGLLDAVTLYAAVALRNLLPAADAESALFDLAKQVEGWGRIHCVLRLKNSRRPDVAHWLLRGGYDSGVMVEELAYVAVTTGGLVAALQGAVDEELLDHAGILLAAMAVGGPAEDLSDWPAGELALEFYLDRMATAPASLGRLSSLATIDRYLCRRARRNPHLTDRGRAALRVRLERVLERADWRRAVEDGWDSDDIRTFHRALANSAAVGLDPVAPALGRIRRHPHDAYLWQVLRDAADRERMRELLVLAEELLDFSSLPTGPSMHLGFGAGFQANRCFEGFLQELERFPGLGGDALQIGLANRTVRARSMAVRALESWPREEWPAAAAIALTATFWVEPDETLRRRIGTLAGMGADAVSEPTT